MSELWYEHSDTTTVYDEFGQLISRFETPAAAAGATAPTWSAPMTTFAGAGVGIDRSGAERTSFPHRGGGAHFEISHGQRASNCQEKRATGHPAESAASNPANHTQASMCVVAWRYAFASRDVGVWWGYMWSSVPCPYCGSRRVARERGQWEWIWVIWGAASLFLRWLLTFARYGEYRGEPGLYRCANCGRAFTFFV